jgi:hypothetical protein
MVKILTQTIEIENCRNCPRSSKYSDFSEKCWCSTVVKKYPDKPKLVDDCNTIPDWCPLEDYKVK